MHAAPPERVIVYLDGFNLYHGMRDANLRRYYWLDVARLSRNLVRSNQELLDVKYFTARLSGNEAKRQRQTTYLEALQAHTGLEPFYGNYLQESVRCRNCHTVNRVPKEKMTDVAIATHMLVDAQLRVCDVAILVTGDSDLIPPVEAITACYPAVRTVVAFPPARHSTALENAVGRRFLRVTDSLLSRSQLPDEVARADGFVLRRPDRWR